MSRHERIRVLYSFPHKLGAARICHTAWEQVNGLSAAGAEVLVFPGVLHRPLPPGIRVHPTLAWGKFRILYKVFGSLRACALHDRIVARRIERLAGKIDIVHTWPTAAAQTLKTAARLGIPTVLERPNAHTRFAYDIVRKECERLGVTLPRGHEHAYNAEVLRREEEEYRLADRLLCPSEFVARTFLDEGYPAAKLARHRYGFDETRYYPDTAPRERNKGLTMISVGVCAVRKGLHYALEAWLRSPAHHDGTFLIAGDFVPEYAAKLAPMLSHPSIKVLGHRNDVPELMRKSDIMVLPSLEEGFSLAIAEAVGSGCVPLVSENCAEISKHMENGLVHRMGDVDALTRHITMLHEDRDLLERLRTVGLSRAPQYTWARAGEALLDAYRSVLSESMSPQPERRNSNIAVTRATCRSSVQVRKMEA